MPEPAPSPASADRNLLFGILALQMDFVTRDALLAAMSAWVLAKHKPLGQVLVEQGGLAPEEHALVEAVVHRHVHNHGGDPQRSLAAVSSIRSLRQDLEQVADPDLQASLALVSAARHAEPDPDLTSDYSAGTPTSSGLRFRVLRPHARGGLGEVFVARDQELHREVALKEIQASHDDPRSRSRFLLEAEVTGGLEHPGVVPVYGLGAYPDGRPFYAMRLIKGDSLKDAIRRFHEADVPGRDPGERRLALRGLLGRFVAVCNAVAYAHSRGVLHRDLKPGNIMLGPYGETLIVDWGLAKVVGRPAGSDGASEGTLRPPSAEGSTPTQVGAAVGTPSYMSPEQAAGKLEELGPASDVYSLGATLYCLLTGRAPFAGKDTGEVLRQVQAGAFAPPRQVQRRVPAALEAVCLKAMALRPADRYGSARALADEVEHWLADEPVAAHREPWPARLARWGRRHRPVVAAAAALLVTAVVMLAAGVVVVNRERQAAEAARKRTRAALDEMSSQVIDDWLSRQEKLEPAQRAFLEKALDYYEGFAAESGQAEEVRHSVAGAHWRVGNIRTRLGQHGEAEAAYRRALELYAGLAADFPAVPEYRLELAIAHNNLGNLLKDTGRLREAEAAYHDALVIYKPLADEFPAVPRYRLELANTHNNLGYLLAVTGRLKEAEAAYHDALALFQPLADEFPAVPRYRQNLATSHNSLGLLLGDTGRPQEAEAAHRAALALQKALADDFPAVPENRRDLASTHNNLGNLLKDTGRPKEAEVAYRDALEIQKALAAKYPAVPQYRQNLATSHNNLGALLRETGRPQEAEGAWREALALQKALAADFPNVPQYRWALALTHTNLGVLLADRGRPKEAEAPYRAALDLYKALAAEFPKVPQYRRELAYTQTNLGNLLRDMGQPREAKAAYRDALEIQKALANGFLNVPDYQNDVGNTLDEMAELARRHKDYPAARHLLEEAQPYLKKALEANPRHPFYREVYSDTRRVLGATLLELGDHAGAAAAAADLARVAFDPAGDAYKAACFLARCIPVAEKDAKLPQARRQELTKSYGDRAMEALRQALAKGYQDAAHMQKDTDLDPLRGRDDFRKLLAELDKGAGKEKPSDDRPQR
jgi:serine/threonine-protein kinase